MGDGGSLDILQTFINAHHIRKLRLLPCRRQRATTEQVALAGHLLPLHPRRLCSWLHIWRPGGRLARVRLFLIGLGLESMVAIHVLQFTEPARAPSRLQR